MKPHFFLLAALSVLATGCLDQTSRSPAPVSQGSYMADPVEEPLTKISRCEAYCASESNKRACMEACGRGQEYEG